MVGMKFALVAVLAVMVSTTVIVEGQTEGWQNVTSKFRLDEIKRYLYEIPYKGRHFHNIRIYGAKYQIVAGTNYIVGYVGDNLVCAAEFYVGLKLNAKPEIRKQDCQRIQSLIQPN